MPDRGQCVAGRSLLDCGRRWWWRCSDDDAPSHPTGRGHAGVTDHGYGPVLGELSSIGSAGTSGTTITAYDWVFGDGGLGSNASTSHIYNTPGNYVATLTVTASNLMVASTAGVTVHVDAPVLTDRYHVKAVGGTDSATCGPLATPCDSIDFGEARAVADAKSLLLVAGSGQAGNAGAAGGSAGLGGTGGSAGFAGGAGGAGLLFRTWDNGATAA